MYVSFGVRPRAEAPAADPSLLVLCSLPVRRHKLVETINLIKYEEEQEMKKMLVCVDGSDYSLAAVKAAAKLAAERGIKKVTLLNVIPTTPTPVGPMPTAAPPEDPEAWEVFDKPREILKGAGVEALLLLREGDPAEEIVQAAREGGFDLIVVGHRGLSPIKAFLLGSVSNRVVTHAPCSVLVVRPGLENNPSKGGAGL